MNELIKIVEAEYQDVRAKMPDFKPGDTVNVHVMIREGNKQRIQQFKGIVIQRKNPNTNGETFTVRKVSNGIGVERIFPILSPNIEKVELLRQGKVRRARLFYMRAVKVKLPGLRKKNSSGGAVKEIRWIKILPNKILSTCPALCRVRPVQRLTSRLQKGC
ncbi:MAG: 50S ribosomal protein L19 [Bacteroidia bacterium]|nr:50S ribosomal protein L19 [Bacteroidia bacterium]